MIQFAILLFTGIGIFGFFRLANHLAHIHAARQKSLKTILRLLPAIELFLWTAWVLWIFERLTIQWRGQQTILLVLVLVWIIIISWFFLRDFFAGVILKTENAFNLNQQIITPEAKGVIRKIGFRSLEVEGETGKFCRIPYSRLSNQIFGLQAPADTVLSHELTLRIVSSQKVAEVKKQITTELLLMPWVSVNHIPEVQVLSEDQGATTYKISYHTSDDTHSEIINQLLRQRFETT